MKKKSLSKFEKEQIELLTASFIWFILFFIIYLIVSFAQDVQFLLVKELMKC